MKNIFKILRISKPLYIWIGMIAVLIVVTSALDLVAPFISKLLVDTITAQKTLHGEGVTQLIYLIALGFALSLLGIFLTAITERLGDHFAGALKLHLTELFYKKTLTLPQSYFDGEVSGRILNQLNRGISTIQMFINTSTNFIIPTFLQSIFTIAALAYYSIPIAFFTALIFPIYISLSYYSTKRWGKEEVKKNKIDDYTRGRINEVITNMKIVKSFSNQLNEFRIVVNGLHKSNKIYAKQSQTFHIFDFFRNLSLILILTLINIIVFYNTFIGKFTLGEMVLILQLLNLTRRPLFATSFILTQIQTAESGSKEFFDILSLPSTEELPKNATYKKVINPSITFKSVGFEYESSSRVFNNINFTLGNAQKIALVGPSGVGKTTIVNLILKFYEPTSGEILLNDITYNNLSEADIRGNIALVLQENELFSSTIRENVAYGMDAKDEQIIRALKQANAYDFVMKLPDKLDSQVGERGVKLSGGQKQRIQIARAILKDSPILILDEATSSLDSKSEYEVQKGFENLMKEKLVIIIAHRLSTIQHVDKIIVLNDGNVVNEGSPKELAQKPGIYRDLLKYQVEGNRMLLKKYDIAS